MQVNVFDTPGFQDSNEDNIKQNNMEIVKQLDSDIHVFLLLFKKEDDRLSADKQEILENFHIWTKGMEKRWNFEIFKFIFYFIFKLS